MGDAPQPSPDPDIPASADPSPRVDIAEHQQRALNLQVVPRPQGAAVNGQILAVRLGLSWLQLLADQRRFEPKCCGGNQAEGFACLDAQQRPRGLFEPLRNGP